MTMQREAEQDYIIVGAGSAGCLRANRLSADLATQVVLLEADGKHRNPLIHTPAGFYRNIYQFETEQDGMVHPVRARREVLLAGGPINSPQLLQLTGLGRAEYTICRVGQYLQDHLNSRVVYRVRRVNTLNEISLSWMRQADPAASPAIQPNYLATQADKDTLIARAQDRGGLTDSVDTRNTSTRSF